MHPDLLTKRVNASVSELCVIVCAYDHQGVSFDQGFLVRDALNEMDTDGWWFFNPGTFIVAFRCAASGVERARACEAALTSLRRDHPSLAQVVIASAEGPVLTSIASEGHLDTPPIGNVVNEAFRKASQNAS